MCPVILSHASIRAINSPFPSTAAYTYATEPSTPRTYRTVCLHRRCPVTKRHRSTFPLITEKVPREKKALTNRRLMSHSSVRCPSAFRLDTINDDPIHDTRSTYHTTDIYLSPADRTACKRIKACSVASERQNDTQLPLQHHPASPHTHKPPGVHPIYFLFLNNTHFDHAALLQ